MKLLEFLEESFVRIRYSHVEKAVEDLEQEKPFFSTLAALNMGWYPFESKESILEDIKEEKIELEKEYPQLA